MLLNLLQMAILVTQFTTDVYARHCTRVQWLYYFNTVVREGGERKSCVSPGRVENGRTRTEPEKYTTTYNHTDLQTEEASFLIFLTLGSLPEILRGIRKEQVSLKLVELVLPTLFSIVQMISLRRHFQKFGWYKSIVCFIRLYWVLIPLRIHSR